MPRDARSSVFRRARPCATSAASGAFGEDGFAAVFAGDEADAASFPPLFCFIISSSSRDDPSEGVPRGVPLPPTALRRRDRGVELPEPRRFGDLESPPREPRRFFPSFSIALLPELRRVLSLDAIVTSSFTVAGTESRVATLFLRTATGRSETSDSGERKAQI